MHCFNCDYDMCPPCAFSKLEGLNSSKLIKTIPTPGIGHGEGILYCGKKFTKQCLCGSCDGCN